MSWGSSAGKGGRPLGGVDWKRQYENSPFLSPLEKRLLAEMDEMREDTERMSDAEWAKKYISRGSSVKHYDGTQNYEGKEKL